MKTDFKWILIFTLCAGVLLLRGESFSQSLRTPIIEKGKRDPFALPYGVHPRSRESLHGIKPKPVTPTTTIQEESSPKMEPKEAPLKLKAVLISDSLRLATINQFIVQEGDEILGERVSEIQPDRVILMKGDQKRTLYLDQSPVKLITEETSLLPSIKRGNGEKGGTK